MKLIFKKNRKSIKYVTVGCNTHPGYAFYLPIINKIWHELGFEMIPILVGDWVSPWQKYVISKLSNIQYMETKQYDSGRLAQVARLYAFENINNNDTIMTSDVDMIPLSRTWFNQSKENVLNIYNEGMGKGSKENTKCCICYIDASKKIWEEIIDESFYDVMDKATYWEFDEDYFEHKLHAWSGYDYKCNFINRKIVNGRLDRRLDRSYWEFNYKIDNMIDCHGFRPFYDENYHLLDNLLKLLNIDYFWMKEYKETFITLLGKP